MKHQYFGDKRDLFKYDLILYLSKELNLKNAYFISMLTENDKSKQGNEINYENSIWWGILSIITAGWWIYLLTQ